MNFRIGFGMDVHRLSGDRKLVLGGVHIPSAKGLLGHSDADVLIHAICDALLGAAGLRDIGIHFPDTSAEFKDIDSRILLKRVGELLQQNGYSIGNLDCTLLLESPKISPYIEQMQHILAKTLGIQAGQIAIKATTNEGMGFVGRGEGASAYAVALVFQP